MTLKASLFCSWVMVCASSLSLAAPMISHVHRGGGANERPDNALGTFEWAWAHGAGSECDVMFTRDRVAVLNHDGTLWRIGRGAEAHILTNRISNLTYAQIKDVDVGSYIDSKYANERVPTLDAALAALKKDPDRTLFVDDKGVGPKYIAERAKALGVLDQVWFTTCKYEAIVDWYGICGGKSREWLGPGTDRHDQESIRKGEARVDHIIGAARRNGFKCVTMVCLDVNYDPKAAEPFVPSTSYLKAFARELHEHGVLFTAIPYQGGNLPEVYDKLKELGADGFCSDYPSAMFSSRAFRFGCGCEK